MPVKPKYANITDGWFYATKGFSLEDLGLTDAEVREATDEIFPRSKETAKTHVVIRNSVLRKLGFKPPQGKYLRAPYSAGKDHPLKRPAPLRLRVLPAGP